MVTDYPQVLVGSQTRARAGIGATLTGGLRWVGQALCGIRGHDVVRHYERNRVALECTSCGHVSPGWTVSAPMPHVRYAGDPLRHQLPPRAVRARRIA
jgi:hypothetical protein